MLYCADLPSGQRGKGGAGGLRYPTEKKRGASTRYTEPELGISDKLLLGPAANRPTLGKGLSFAHLSTLMYSFLTTTSRDLLVEASYKSLAGRRRCERAIWDVKASGRVLFPPPASYGVA